MALWDTTGVTIHPHYFNLTISLKHTAHIISVMGEDIVQSNHCQGLICVICKPIDPISQLKMSSVTFSYSLICSAVTCSVQWHPTFQ